MHLDAQDILPTPIVRRHHTSSPCDVIVYHFCASLLRVVSSTYVDVALPRAL